MTRYSILKGPKKWALDLAFFSKIESVMESGLGSVTFEILNDEGNTSKISVAILALRRDGLTSEQWHFEGLAISLNGDNFGKQPVAIEGIYSTADLTGHLDMGNDFSINTLNQPTEVKQASLVY